LRHCAFALENVPWQDEVPWQLLTQAMVHFWVSLSFLQSFAHLLLHFELSAFMQLTYRAWAGERQAA
jgi:hypothetical protein